MSVLQTLGVHKMLNYALSCAENYSEMIDNKTFDKAGLKEKLLRTIVAVGTTGVGVGALKLGVALGTTAASSSLMPIIFTAVALAAAHVTAGFSLVLLIPALFTSLPAVIYTAGAVLTVAAGCASLNVAARSFSLI